MYEDNAVKEMVAEIPEGFGAVAVQFTSWSTYSDFQLYMLPVGTVLPDGKVVSSGDYVKYFLTDRSHKELLSFFRDYRNMLGWTKLDSFILESRCA